MDLVGLSTAVLLQPPPAEVGAVMHQLVPAMVDFITKALDFVDPVIAPDAPASSQNVASSALWQSTNQIVAPTVHAAAVHALSVLVARFFGEEVVEQPAVRLTPSTGHFVQQMKQLLYKALQQHCTQAMGGVLVLNISLFARLFDDLPLICSREQMVYEAFLTGEISRPSGVC